MALELRQHDPDARKSAVSARVRYRGGYGDSYFFRA